MSLHFFDTHQGKRPVTVVMGYDRRDDRFYMEILAHGSSGRARPAQDNSSRVYASYEDGRVPRFDHEIDYFRAKLEELGIALPENMLRHVAFDCMHQAPDRVVQHLGENHHQTLHLAHAMGTTQRWLDRKELPAVLIELRSLKPLHLPLAKPHSGGSAPQDVLRSTHRLRVALDNIVGPGSQHEKTCDVDEHDPSSGCIYCEGRAALAAPLAQPGALTWELAVTLNQALTRLKSLGTAQLDSDQALIQRGQDLVNEFDSTVLAEADRPPAEDTQGSSAGPPV